MAATDSNAPRIEWGRIDTVFLDMDGTLLDLAKPAPSKTWRWNCR